MSASPTTERTPGPTLVATGAELALVVVLSVAPLLWRAGAGIGDTPAGDAWAYQRIAETFHETGRLVLVDWNDITLVGMMPVTELWVRLVGFGGWQLNALGSVMGIVALLALRHLLVTLGVRHRWLPLLVFGTFSGFLSVTGTYLSDLFALAGALWAVALVARLVAPPATASGPGVSIVAFAAALTAFGGFSVRQHAVAAAIAAGWLLLRARRRIGGAWLVFAATFGLLSVPFYLWRMGLEHSGDAQLAIQPRGATEGMVDLWFTLGLLALPFMVVIPVRRRRSIALQAIAVAPTAAILAAALAERAGLVESHGVAIGALGSGGILTVLAWVVVVGAVAWSWYRIASLDLPPRPLTRELLLALVVCGAVEVAAVLAAGIHFSRYTLLTGAVAVAVLARTLHDSGPDRNRTTSWTTAAPAVAVVVAVAIHGMWELDSSAAELNVVSAAAEVAACAGIPPQRVDGGFVWNGMHYHGTADSAMAGEPHRDGLPVTPDQLIFPELDRLAVVTTDPPDAPHRDRAVGPVRATGLLPTSRASAWIIVGAQHLDELERCWAHR